MTDELEYVFDAVDGREVAPLLDLAAWQESDLALVALSWSRNGASGEHRLRNDAVSLGLSYELEVDQTNPSRVKLEPYGSEGSPWIRPLSLTDSETARLWGEIALEVRSPLLIAHFTDLRFTLRGRNPQTARALVSAYMGVDEQAESWVLGLMRANSISREFKLLDRELEVRERMLAYSEANLFEGEKFWRVLQALSALSVGPRGADRPDAHERVRAVIEDAWNLVGGNVTFADLLATVDLRAASSTAERKQAGQRHVRAYMTDTSAGSGLRKALLLEKAASLAGRYDLTPERDAAVSAMQRLDPSAVQGTVRSAALQVPRWRKAIYLRPYRRASHWSEAFDLWLNSSPPSIQPERDPGKASPINGDVMGFATRVRFGSHGLPERTFKGRDDIHQYRQAQNYQRLTRLAGEFLADGLDVIASRFPSLDEEALAAHLLASGADQRLTGVLAHALKLYLAGRPSDAGTVAVPVVEAAARGVLLSIDEPLYRVASEKSSGRFPAVDMYLNALEERGFDPDWMQLLRTTMTPDGLDIRNEVAHGFKFAFTKGEAALVLRLAGLLALLSSPELTQHDTAWAHSKLRFPLDHPSRRRWRLVRF